MTRRFQIAGAALLLSSGCAGNLPIATSTPCPLALPGLEDMVLEAAAGGGICVYNKDNYRIGLSITEAPDAQFLQAFRREAIALQRGLAGASGGPSIRVVVELPDQPGLILRTPRDIAFYGADRLNGDATKAALWMAQLGQQRLAMTAHFPADDTAHELLASIAFSAWVRDVAASLPHGE